VSGTHTAVKLYDGPGMGWKSHFVKFMQLLMEAHGQTAPQVADAADALFTVLLDLVNERLPDGCHWAPGAQPGIYGPPGTQLPDIPALIQSAYAEIAEDDQRVQAAMAKAGAR
jgi:hypothetical protein